MEAMTEVYPLESENFSFIPFCNNTGTTEDHQDVVKLKWLAYGVILPILVAFGVLGDILNLVVLTRPNMKGVAYIYMRAYATASFFALLCAIPFTHRVLTHELGRWETFPVAFFHARIVLYFGNSCIGVSVVMLLALTVERYISVCFPARARNMCGASRRAYTTVVLLPIVTFLLNSPYLFLAEVIQCRDERGSIVFMKDINEDLTLSTWFNVYKWLMEISYKLLPAAVLFYLNIHIIYTYRAVCERRRRMTNGKVSGEQKRQYAEESRLMFLLGGTSAIFFVCMTPMIALSVTVHFSHFKQNYFYQIFRALANVLEVTNFSVTFYIYCLFSKDFRETFLAFVRSATRSAVPISYFGSVSGIRDTLRPP